MSNELIWSPDPVRRDESAMAALYRSLIDAGVNLPPIEESGSYLALHRWSIDNLEQFWSEIWNRGEVIGDRGSEMVLAGGERMGPPAVTGTRWFPDARLNFAENLLRRNDDATAVIAWDERGPAGEISWRELRHEVACLAQRMRELGVQRGDRVAGWLPNIPAAVVGMLATASLGATWTSCSPDFGVDGIVDRFGQTEPVLLIFADGYFYGGRQHDCQSKVLPVLDRIPSIRHAIRVHHAGISRDLDDSRIIEWETHRIAAPEPLSFEPVPFDHPLYILYSSGTTGLPKCLVHGVGGTLLQHVKELSFHTDLRNGERLCYFTTCGWMMWNWLVSGLAVGATLVLYDGSPMPPSEPDILWRMIEETDLDVFGTSAKYLSLAEKSGIGPRRGRTLGRLRAVLSTGSPLSPESFEWVRREVGPVQVASISGGTDIVSCFVLGNPIAPVWRGEIQGPGLGMSVEVFDDDGRPAAIGQAGELVCTRPFPSMPVGFWGDSDGRRYLGAYFERWDGVWCHGDWATRTASGGFVISGRSDATLNPGGVRIGTAEIYRQVETIDEVVESLVIGQRIHDDVRVVLFVKLRDGVELEQHLVDTIKRRIREGASPHHVPKVVLEVDDIPRTRSGKLSELAVRDVVEGRAVRNVGALANPAALEQFRDRPELAVDRVGQG